jgi:zinc D-Ala-D-Ala carboxypeptidase
MTEAKKAKAKKPENVENKYFSHKELKCKHTGENKFDPVFLDLLTKIRIECDFPFAISSAYRSPQHPIEVRKSRLGAHTTGKAVDILCRGENAVKLISVAVAFGITRIGVQQKGSGRFIHLDVCTQEDFPEIENYPEETIWSY